MAKLRPKARGLLFIALGIGFLAFYGLLVVETAVLPIIIGLPLFNAYPAALGVFFILWGYYTLRSDNFQQDSP